MPEPPAHGRDRPSGTSGWTIGRVFGIRIAIDPSWVIIFALVAWSLSAGLFPHWHPAWSSGTAWLVGVSSAVLLFVSVLAHELAHSVMARRLGVGVDSITLFLFGGVSSLGREPSSPLDEFLITVVGPMTSAVIGVVSLTAALAGVTVSGVSTTQLLASLTPLQTALLWLGEVNVALAIFNLLPGYPLDGGRLLRAALWARGHDAVRATRQASLVGQVMAGTLIGIGILLAGGVVLPGLGGGIFNGLWLILIGLFLYSAALQSRRQLELKVELHEVVVSELMHRRPPLVETGTAIEEVVQQRITGSTDRSFFVTHDGTLVGLLTMEDVQRVPEDRRVFTRVEDVMEVGDVVATVAPDDPADVAVEHLLHADQVAVVAQGHVVGALDRDDVTTWFRLHHPQGRR